MKKQKAGVPAKLTRMQKALLKTAVVMPGDRVLEIGCETPDFLRVLRRQQAGRVACTAICLTPEDTRKKRQQMKKADVLYARPDELPWDEPTFDLVFLPQKVGGEKMAAQVLRETRRVLAPGGQCMLPLTAVPAPLARLRGVLQKQQGPSLAPDAVAHAMRKAGFCKVKCFSPGIFLRIAVGFCPNEKKKKQSKDVSLPREGNIP